MFVLASCKLDRWFPARQSASPGDLDTKEPLVRSYDLLREGPVLSAGVSSLMGYEGISS